MTGSAHVIRANSRHLPLADNTVDLVVTSPPYFALRSYQDGCLDCENTGKAKRPDSHGMKVCPDCGNVANRKRCNKCDASMKWPSRAETFTDDACSTCNGTGKGHYAGQIGDEPTPAEFVASLLDVTRECVRVLKPSGSLWVNLGDKYSTGSSGDSGMAKLGEQYRGGGHTQQKAKTRSAPAAGFRPKTLLGIPWRYALACIDDLGLILRAEVIWSKPNGLPESVTDRVRRSHEQWFHFVLQPRYFSAVDEIREATTREGLTWDQRKAGAGREKNPDTGHNYGGPGMAAHALGKLPGSVWTIPTEPLRVPDHLGVDHFAAFPTAFPKRIIAGWSPAGVCVECGEGRRPVMTTDVRVPLKISAMHEAQFRRLGQEPRGTQSLTNGVPASQIDRTITGYSCACPEPTADTTPAVVLDPFGGTGTTAMVAKALGRTGISVDMSQDYSRLAQWRVNDLDQLAKVQGIKRSDAARDADSLEMDSLFDMEQAQQQVETPPSRTCPECGFRNNLSNRRNCEKCGAEKRRSA